jgi:hypothetical protein
MCKRGFLRQKEEKKIFAEAFKIATTNSPHCRHLFKTKSEVLLEMHFLFISHPRVNPTKLCFSSFSDFCC